MYPLNDGSVISLMQYCEEGTSGHYSGSGFEIDVNGLKGPNKKGRDRFKFCLVKGGGVFPDFNKVIFGNLSGARLKQKTPITREELLNDCKTSSDTCISLIMYDGWEIRSDYPYKL